MTEKNRCPGQRFNFLFCAENPVAGISQAGNDVTVVIQAVIQRGAVDIHVGMRFLKCVQAFRGGNGAHKFDVFWASLFNHRDGVDGGTAGSAHGIYDDDVAFLDIMRQLAVILNGLQGFGIAVKADVTDSGGGDQCCHAVNHAKAGAEDRNDGKLFT